MKLQPPSATDLPAFNPILPPSAITQVLLLANPQKVNIFIGVLIDLEYLCKVTVLVVNVNVMKVNSQCKLKLVYKNWFFPLMLARNLE